MIITYFSFPVEGQAEMFQVGEKRNSNRYCGPILSDMLAIVCDGIYNEKKYQKSYESDLDEEYGFGQQQPYLDIARLPFPYRTRPNAAALLSGSFRRYTRGVTDECCKKPCTISELRTYCKYGN